MTLYELNLMSYTYSRRTAVTLTTHIFSRDGEADTVSAHLFGRVKRTQRWKKTSGFSAEWKTYHSDRFIYAVCASEVQEMITTQISSSS